MAGADEACERDLVGRRHSRLLVWRRPMNDLWNNTYVCVLRKPGQCCVQLWISTCERRWTRAISTTPMGIGAVVSTCACCGKAGHEKARCRFRNAKCRNCGKTGHLKAMCRQREKSAGKSSPSSSSRKSSGKGGTSRGNTHKCNCCGQVGHRRPDCPRRSESCSLCGKRGHLSEMCRSSGGNASARAVSVCDTSGIQSDALSVCDNSGLPSGESGNLLNMIMDSGTEEHVVSLADVVSVISCQSE